MALLTKWYSTERHDGSTPRSAFTRHLNFELLERIEILAPAHQALRRAWPERMPAPPRAAGTRQADIGSW